MIVSAKNLTTINVNNKNNCLRRFFKKINIVALT